MTPRAPAPQPPELLLIEDTPSLQMLYRAVLSKAGYRVICAESGATGRAKFDIHRPPVVVLDLMLPDMDGMALIDDMLAQAPKTRIIVITADGTVDRAIDATRKGAHDFLVKPLGDMRLVTAVSAAMTEYRAQARYGGALGGDMPDLGKAFFSGPSDSMAKLLKEIAAVARSCVPLVVLGERGCGKRAVAELVHQHSARAAKPFVVVDCALQTGPALEEALFGTEASPQGHPRLGALARAHGGTLLIAQPEAMEPALQLRLLAALQSGLVGTGQGGAASACDLRLICATRQHPAADMQAGRLTEEFYYQCCVIPLHVPPLAARRDDIVPLALHLVAALARAEGKHFSRISDAAAEKLRTRPWPGNLRELINVLRHAVILHDGPELGAAMLPECPALTEAPPTAQTLEEAMKGLSMAEIERRAFLAALARHDGSVPRAARELDIAPSTLYRRRDVLAQFTP
jgi:two-component system, repressor protein LuxO